MLESWATRPGCVYGPVDCRHLDEVTLAKMDQEEREMATRLRWRARALALKRRQICSVPAAPCAPDGVAAVAPRRRATSTRTRRLPMAAQTQLAFEPVHQLRDRMTG